MSFGLGSAAVPAESSIPIDASTPWVTAADGNLTLLQNALNQLDLSPSAADEHGYTLLQAAASYGQIAIMQWLLSSSSSTGPHTSAINVNAVDSEGDSALHYAGTVEAARFLLHVAHMDASVRNNAGLTALETKRAELEELQQDEDLDEEDQDFINLRLIVEFLSSLDSMAQ